MNLKTSARNQLTGAVMQVTKGAVNDEVSIVLDGSGTRIVAIVTGTSTKSLGLEPGKKVVVLIKAPWVILVTEMEGVKFSARNQLPGTVTSVKDGVVNGEVRVRLDGGEVITAIVTIESIKHLELEPGKRVTAMIKASHLILGAIQ